MKKIKEFKGIYILVFAVCLLLTAGKPMQVRAASSPVSICNKQEWEVLIRLNQERMKRSLGPLSTISKLQKAAGIRAEETKRMFSHTRPDGSECFTVLKEAGVSYNSAGENIAAGQDTPFSVMQAWMSSTGHRENILGEGFSHVGVGYYYQASSDYGSYWTQLFSGTCTPKSISVKDGDKVSSCQRGTDIDDMNRILVVKCQHGTGYMPLLSDMCRGYSKNTAGVQTITVTYKGKTAEFKVKTAGISIKKAAVTRIKSKTYTGGSITQSPLVVLNGKKLKKNTDYTLSYQNNKNAGKASVIIRGKGKYTGTIKKTFTIKKRSLKYVAVGKIKNQAYTGKRICPSVKLTYRGKTVSRKYYSVTYKNNLKTGKAVVTIKGKGNFTGTLKKTFRIVKKTT